jgi:DNA polymerase delta subunit 2
MDVDQGYVEAVAPKIVFHAQHDQLLKMPESKEEMSKTLENKTERAVATCTIPNPTRFLLDAREQSHQYFNVYQCRARQLRPAVVERIQKLQKENGTDHPVEERILDVRMGIHSFLVGTIFKEMPLKPNVLREYSREQAILLVPEKHSFVSSSDSLILEDETGRIKLVLANEKLVSDSITGSVVAVLGTQIEGGAFKVEDIWTPGMPAQMARQPRLGAESNGKGHPSAYDALDGTKYVALVSDLNIGTPTFNPLLSALLSDYLCGHLGGDDEQQSVPNRVVRTLLVGNTFCSEEDVPAHSKLRDHTKSFSIADQARLDLVLKEADAFVFSLAANMTVDVIPGPKDPSNYSMPQQPLNRCLFPRAAQLTSLHLPSNPYSAVIDGVEFLGHSGQPTQNILNYITLNTDEDILDVLERTLNWCHMAPTAPDTLSAFPFKFHDPFIIDSCPHVYFVGNQDEFDSRRVEGPDGQVVQLVAVPSFIKTKSFVLLNLQTLDCHPVTISTWDD